METMVKNMIEDRREKKDNQAIRLLTDNKDKWFTAMQTTASSTQQMPGRSSAI